MESAWAAAYTEAEKGTRDAGMANPTAAILIIGDEILSGRTRDSNMHFLAGELARHGVDLREARMVADDADAIVAAVNALRAGYDHVFTSGGIGPTHDDITADCIAAAFGVGIGIRADARAILAAHYDRAGLEFNEARQRMARIPDGATLIDNPVSSAPGFTLGNVHVMAGVPKIFEAMVASVLPTITGGAPLLSQTWRVDRGEGEVADPLGALAREYGDLSFGSYPFQRNGAHGTNLVVRGTDGARIDAAIARLAALFPQG
jgi:molybdenum cofactor synthesis domain-containing protein